jgi:N-acetylmuramic acid 6-phosphate etherase
MKGKPQHLEKLTTEQLNAASIDLDLKSGVEIARIINAEDARVPAAIARALPQIGHAIDLIAAQLRRGGRLIYVGTGTSGRVGALMLRMHPPSGLIQQGST